MPRAAPVMTAILSFSFMRIPPTLIGPTETRSLATFAARGRGLSRTAIRVGRGGPLDAARCIAAVLDSNAFAISPKRFDLPDPTPAPDLLAMHEALRSPHSANGVSAVHN